MLAAGTYTIRLADAAHGAPTAGFLTCHNTSVHGRDLRSGDSVYVHVNSKDYVSNKWHLEVVGDAYTIRLANAALRAPKAGFLSCHNTVSGRDVRSGDSVYVHANTTDYGSSKWHIKAVGDAYIIRLADAAHGAPSAGFLSCHNTVEGRDLRDDDSVYVHANSTDYGSTKWHLQKL